ncbi:MAG: hypothetical protein KKF48_01005 [Nanoarchaeota archaeon]|nr:hypothetical protein [Nanoarchaeota archaeon]MBU1027602.1 hypothetical protein [Nanoarchaeota archaeon]
MKFKEFIQLDKKKLLITLVLFIIWVIFAHSINQFMLCDCIDTPLDYFETCTDYYDYLIFDSIECHCTCVQGNKLIRNYFWFGLIPLIIIYLIVSIIFYLLNRRRK